MTKLVFVGLGAMGIHLARHVSQASASRGIPIYGYDVDPNKTRAAHAAYGIQVIENLHSLDGDQTIWCLSLPDGSAVKTVVRDEHVRQLAAQSVVLDFSSTAPKEAREIAADLSGIGIEYIDAPVTGGVHGAEEGSLVVVAGGSQIALNKFRWVPESFSQSIVWAGPSGSGALLKSINNMIANIAGIAAMEGIGILPSAGISDDVILEVLNKGTGVTYFSKVRYPKYVMTKTFNAGMKIGLVNKDLSIAMEAAGEIGSHPVLSSLGRELWRAALIRYGADADTTRMIDLVSRLATGKPWE